MAYPKEKETYRCSRISGGCGEEYRPLSDEAIETLQPQLHLSPEEVEVFKHKMHDKCADCVKKEMPDMRDCSACGVEHRVVGRWKMSILDEFELSAEKRKHVFERYVEERTCIPCTLDQHAPVEFVSHRVKESTLREIEVRKREESESDEAHVASVKKERAATVKAILKEVQEKEAQAASEAREAERTSEMKALKRTLQDSDFDGELKRELKRYRENTTPQASSTSDVTAEPEVRERKRSARAEAHRKESAERRANMLAEVRAEVDAVIAERDLADCKRTHHEAERRESEAVKPREAYESVSSTAEREHQEAELKRQKQAEIDTLRTNLQLYDARKEIDREEKLKHQELSEISAELDAEIAEARRIEFAEEKQKARENQDRNHQKRIREMREETRKRHRAIQSEASYELSQGRFPKI